VGDLEVHLGFGWWSKTGQERRRQACAAGGSSRWSGGSGETEVKACRPAAQESPVGTCGGVGEVK
jgi:hypothetical protein